MQQSLIRAIGTATIAVLLLAAPSLAASSAPQAALSGDVLTWSLAGDNDGATLRISGQGVIVEQTFARGAAPTQSAFDNGGNALPDGTYTWELRAHAAPIAGTDQAAIRRSQEGQPVQRTDNYSGEVISGAFTILNGAIVDPGLAEAGAISEASSNGSGIQSTTEGAVTNVTLADQVILDDLIVDGSICAGFDCVSGEDFGFDTIRLKENNLRIKFEDTSTGSFPSRDWQLTANDSANGGQNKFSIDDIDGGRTPFTIEAGAPSNSLYVDDGGRVGLGTSTPVVELHVVNGDSPTLRLEQNGSSGFTPQTWDIAGNETNFFVRDATNGSTLPFRIKPAAPSSSIFIDTDGDVAFGTSAPDADAAVDILRTDAAITLLEIRNTNATAQNTGVRINNGAASGAWDFRENTVGQFTIALVGTGNMLTIDDNTGLVTVANDLSITGTCTGCDAVFSPDFPLPSIEEQGVLMYEKSHLPAVGPTNEGTTSIRVFEKTTGMLQELEKAHIYIQHLNERLTALEKALQEAQEN